MKHFYFFLLLFCFHFQSGYGQTLAAGDIAFVSFNSDATKSFSFVALKDIPSGEVINFTDNGWLAAGGFRLGEGVDSWTSPGVNCGDIITVLPASMILSASGDQIIAYQGDSASPTNIAAINSEASGWQTDATNSNTSALPTGLTDGVNAIALNEVDNAAYTGTTSFATPADALSSINNLANWVGDNAINQNPPSSITISSCSGSCSATITATSATCVASTTGTDTYDAVFTVDMGSETAPFSVSLTSASGSLSTTTMSASGTITVSGVNEGENAVIAISNTNCSLAATQTSPDCLPAFTTCFDLSTGTELFELVSVTQNSSGTGGQWVNNSGVYQANGYCGSGCAEPVESWLLFGPLDFSTTTGGYLHFDATEQYGVTDLEVLSTTSYVDCPTDATWTTIQTLTDGGSYYIDLSSLSGTGDYIAIKYADDGTDGYSNWSLSNVSLLVDATDTCPSLGTRPVSNCASCTASLTADTATCDATTENPDTYTGTFSLDLGSETDTFSISASTGTPDQTSITSTGVVTITVTGATEGTDIVLTATSTDCSLEATLVSPICIPTPEVRINELDSDTPGTDLVEFVELRGPANQSLDGFVLVFYNGSGLGVYNTIDLTGQVCPDDGDGYGYFVVGSADVPNVDMVAFGSNAIQNGPEGIGLYFGRSASEFSTGATIDQVNFLTGLVDGIQHGTSDAAIPELVPLLIDREFEDENGVVTTVDIIDENYYADKDNQSIQRGSWFVAPPTVGAANALVTPVTFASISAEYVNKIARVHWKTITEHESDYFNVEHSIDGQQWFTIGQLRAAGTTQIVQNYQFDHQTVVGGTNYYRIKQVDLSSHVYYSDIVSLQTDAPVFGIATVSKQAINLISAKSGEAHFTIFNSQGRIVSDADFDAIKGSQSIYFKNGGLDSGYYIVRLTIGSNQLVKQFIVH